MGRKRTVPVSPLRSLPAPSQFVQMRGRLGGRMLPEIPQNGRPSLLIACITETFQPGDSLCLVPYIKHVVVGEPVNRWHIA